MFHTDAILRHSTLHRCCQTPRLQTVAITTSTMLIHLLHSHQLKSQHHQCCFIHSNAINCEHTLTHVSSYSMGAVVDSICTYFDPYNSNCKTFEHSFIWSSSALARRRLTDSVPFFMSIRVNDSPTYSRLWLADSCLLGWYLRFANVMTPALLMAKSEATSPLVIENVGLSTASASLHVTVSTLKIQSVDINAN